MAISQLEDLGPVPGRADHTEEWRRLAAEVAAYRRTYNIADSEPGLSPKKHLKDSSIAQELRNRAAELHKHGELTTREPMQAEAKEQVAQQKAEQAVTTVKQPSAEDKLAALRAMAQGKTKQDATPKKQEEMSIAEEQPRKMERTSQTTSVSKKILDQLRKQREEKQGKDDQRKLKNDEAQRRSHGGPTLG